MCVDEAALELYEYSPSCRCLVLSSGCEESQAVEKERFAKPQLIFDLWDELAKMVCARFAKTC
jgi:hypothetical protein